MRGRVVLLSSESNPNYLRRCGRDFSFVCFVDDYQKRKKWEKALTPLFRKIPLKPLLEEQKKNLRDSFIDFVNTLGKNGDEFWPLCAVAEENTFVSNLFLDCLRLKVLEELISRGEEMLIVVVDDPYLLKAIRELLKQKGLSVQTRWSLKHYVKKMKVELLPFFHLTKFIIKSVRQLSSFQGLKKENPKLAEGGFHIVLHTWVDDGAFTSDGKYRDRYFGRLIDWLIQKGHNLFIVPHIYNTKRPLREVYKLLASSGYNFIIPQQYYRLTDYFRAMARSLKILSLSRKKASFKGLDLTKLAKREAKRQTMGMIPFFMYLELFLRLKERGFRFDFAIDVFEGMIPERAWFMGFSKAYPEGKTISCQHTLFSKDLLCYFVYRGASLQKVLPSRIVCTGEMVKNLLVREGLPEDRLAVGCALRYEYLWNTKVNPSNTKSHCVLIGLPLQLSGAAEILAITSSIAKKRKDIEFYVKPHPMMSRNTLSNILREVKWPRDETSIAEGAMEKWVGKVDLLISTASAAVVDAMVMGRPVVIVGRDGVLDLNPLDWIESPLTRTYFGEEEIEERIDEILRRIGEERENTLSFGRDILMGCFNPVTEDTLKNFLPV